MTRHDDLHDRAYQRCYDSEYDRWIAAGLSQAEAHRKAKDMASRYAARVEASGSTD